MEEKDLTREPGGKAWWEEEVEMLERRRARRPRQELRPGAQSSKLERFCIFVSILSSMQDGNGHEGASRGDRQAGGGDAGELLSGNFDFERK